MLKCIFFKDTDREIKKLTHHKTSTGSYPKFASNIKRILSELINF